MKFYPFSIPVGDAVIRVTSETTFDILTEFVDFPNFEIPSTADIASIVEVLRNPDWNELQVNAAVAALNAPQEALAAQEWPTLAGTLAGDQQP